MTDDRLLSTQEAADFLGVKQRVLAAQWANWGIPVVRVGKHNRFRLSSLVAWTKDHEITERTPANV